MKIVKNSPPVSIVLVILIISFVESQALWIEGELVGIENSDSGLARTNFRVSRKGKSCLIYGEFNLSEDMKDNYDCEVKSYFSAKGNNQYVMLPYKIAKGPCCEMMDTFYWKSFQQDLEKVSDVPKNNGTERLCFSYKKGKYTVRGFTMDTRVIPRFLETGTYKCTAFVYKINSKEVDSNVTVIGRLY